MASLDGKEMSFDPKRLDSQFVRNLDIDPLTVSSDEDGGNTEAVAKRLRASAQTSQQTRNKKPAKNQDAAEEYSSSQSSKANSRNKRQFAITLSMQTPFAKKSSWLDGFMPKLREAKKLFLRHHLLIGSVSFIVILIWTSFHLFGTELAAKPLADGTAQMNKHQYNDAITSLDAAIYLNKKCAEAYLRRGMCYSALGHTNKALEDFNQTLSLQPNNTQGLEQRANANFWQAKYALAIDDYQKLRKLAPDSFIKKPQLLKNYALAYLNDGKPELALKQLNAFIEHFRYDEKVYMAKASCYQTLGQWDRALAQYDLILQGDRANTDAMLEKGLCLEQLNRTAESLSLLNRVIATDPVNARAYKGRAQVYAKHRDYSAALSDLDKAISLNPIDQEAYRQRADLFIQNGNSVAALKSYNKLATMPHFQPEADFYLNRADILMHLGNAENAIKDLDRAMAHDWSHKAVYLAKQADCYAAMKDYSQAVLKCKMVLDENPNCTEALVKHGTYSNLTGNRMTAMQDMFKALAINPRSVDAYLARAELYEDHGQFASAANDLRQAIAIDATAPGAKGKLANCLAHMKALAHNNAQATFTAPSLSKTSLLEIKNSDFSTLVQKGYAALTNGDTAYAVSALARAVKLQPNQPIARQYLLQALLNSGETDAAIQQFYALEALACARADDGLTLASQVNDSGDKESATQLLRHIMLKNTTDSHLLLRIAKLADTFGLNTLCSEACDRGLKVCNDVDQLVDFKVLKRFVAEKKDDGGGQQPFATSDFGSGQGEPVAK